jgi:glutamyl-tRNA synthetase
MKEAGWDVIRPNLTQISEAAVWWRIVTGPVDSESAPEDTEFLVAAARIAAGIDWSANPWHALTNALKAETDRKGKALFLPLRRALTGLDHGPDMAALLPLIGREETLIRLSA